MGRLKRTIKNTIAKRGFAVTRLKKIKCSNDNEANYLKYASGDADY